LQLTEPETQRLYGGLSDSSCHNFCNCTRIITSRTQTLLPTQRTRIILVCHFPLLPSLSASHCPRPSARQASRQVCS
jgi:hypothetical protein